MKVLFTHTYFLKNDVKEQTIMKPYPPLGLLYLSAWLDKFNISNEVFDSTFATREDQRNFILTNTPDVLAIYTNLITKLEVAALVQYIRNEKALSNIRIVLGGPDITYNIYEYLGLGVDILVIGEGEQTMLEIVQTYQLELNKNLDQIDGIAYKNDSGQIIKTKARQKLSNLDELPLPARHKIDINQYLNVWKKHHNQNTLSVSTQRGCPYTCKWCSTAVYGQSYRRRSPKAVVDELESLTQTYSPDQFWFVDDVFTVSHKWLEEFKVELHTRKLKIKFECITRADRMNETVIHTLKEAGCFRVWIGAESGSQKVLDAMDRRVDASYVQQMIIASKKNNIEAGTFIMLGYPGETEEDIIKTLDHLRTSNPDLFTITIAYPIKGTELYTITESSQLKGDWNTSTDREIDFKRTYSRRYYDYAVKWIVNKMMHHKLIQKDKPDFIQRYTLQLKIIAARLGMNFYRMSSKII